MNMADTSHQAKSCATLSVDNVSWAAPSSTRGKALPILSNVSLSIDNGKFVGLIGPNGAGKSTLLRTIYRACKPDSGKVLVNGKDIWTLSSKEAARNTAVILQEQNEYMGLTVRDVVAQGLNPHKGLFEWDTHSDRERITSLMLDMELQELQHRPFSIMSGGEKQRAFLARALLQSPELLLMDEPTNHLDIHFQLEVIRKVKALPMTVFASFHDLNLAAAFCDELIVIDHGKIVAQGTPSDILTEDLISKVYRTCSLVDTHPLHGHPRVSFAYHD